MAESLSEQQPSLPVFPGEATWYHVKRPADQPPDLSSERVIKVAVDDIDTTVSDEKLRAALWEQFCARQTGERHAHFVCAEADGSYSHTLLIPKGPLFPTLETTEG